MCKHIQTDINKSWCEECCNRLAVMRHWRKYGKPHRYLENKIGLCAKCNLFKDKSEFCVDESISSKSYYGPAGYWSSNCHECNFNEYMEQKAKNHLYIHYGMKADDVRKNPELLSIQVDIIKTKFLLNPKNRERFNFTNKLNISK